MSSVLFKKHCIHTYIGGDPGGRGGTCPPPPRIFLGGGRPPSIFESLKNIYSYICILNTMKVYKAFNST